MKKMQYVGLLLSLFAMLVSIAAAPLAGTAIALIEVRNDPGGNIIFVFRVDGEFSKSELKGFVQVQGGDANYTMHCNQVETDRVNCTVSRKAGGKNVIVTFGGATFWASVPEERLPAAPQSKYCYNVWDSVRPSEEGYEIQTTHCQDSPANYGDLEYIYNPVWEATRPYDFLAGCGVRYVDVAYYYKCGSLQ